MDMDAKDWEILRALQRDGRASAADIAERIYLSPSSVSRRIARLEQERVVKGYRAEVDQQKVGYELTVMVEISLDSQSDEAFSAFEAAVAKIPSVHACYLMSGEMDYLLRVVARNMRTLNGYIVACYRAYRMSIGCTPPLRCARLSPERSSVAESDLRVG